MNVPPESQPAPQKPVSPTQEAGRRRCLNCNTWIKLDGRNPGNDAKRRYCNDDCRNEYNRYGSAYGPLKSKIESLAKENARAEAPKAVALELRRLIETPEFREALEFAGFVHRSQVKRRPEELRASTLAARIDKLGEQLTATTAAAAEQLRALRRQIRDIKARQKPEPSRTRKTTPRKQSPRPRPRSR